MQTNFTLAQLADPDMKASEAILRKCVHCGFCTATCPTYTLLGDELDSPRGRIYLIKDMLEKNRPADARTVKHVDRCLSCLSCMTTCPSGVNYMHLVDHARAHIEATYVRPWHERLLRRVLASILPHPQRFRVALVGALLARPLKGLLPQTGPLARLRAMLEMAPTAIPSPSQIGDARIFPAQGETKMRVALLQGCAQQVLAPQINEATVRVLTRLGCEVAIAPGSGCCGALTHHMGNVDASHASAAANIRAWMGMWSGRGPDAIVVNASGCGTTVKDYGFMFREDAQLKAMAEAVSSRARDISEVLRDLKPAAKAPEALVVAYHSACSLQHGQKLGSVPRKLLADAGFAMRDPAEGHLCCGSAGTYNLMQPEIAKQLQARKVANLAATGASLVAAGNIGCMAQIAAAADMPVVHTVELMDWATGGPKPAALGA
ncbi:MAG: glycolate oxidase subunit GlcF [Magnetospirillum sp.]|jgi:glycolate oxidase iron-sulfur subunit|nr:glycolate oxidase subunit GlcF [Magnetospirillum sp.]